MEVDWKVAHAAVAIQMGHWEVPACGSGRGDVDEGQKQGDWLSHQIPGHYLYVEGTYRALTQCLGAYSNGSSRTKQDFGGKAGGGSPAS